jgi:hypothetical protein
VDVLAMEGAMNVPEHMQGQVWELLQAKCQTEELRQAPHVLMRPRLSIDGNMWCALYGENVQDGVAGFGGSPEEACADFDSRWRTALSADGVRVSPITRRVAVKR